MSVRRDLGAAVAALTVIASIGSSSVALSVAASPAAAATRPAATTTWTAEHRTGQVRLHGEVPLAVRNLAAGRKSVVTLAGTHQATAPLSLSFGLPLRDRAALNALIATEAKTHHYESRASLYREFAPPATQLDALRTWLVAHGYTITHVGRDRTSIAATAATSTVESSLSTTVNNYVRKGYTFEGVKVAAYPFFANTANPQVPARLGVQSITGLSNVDRFFTDLQLSKAAAHLRGQQSGPNGVDTRAGGGYYPQDLRAMYDVSGHGVDATGQTMGFTLWGAGETQAAMTQFAATTGDTPITVDAPCVATGNSPTVPSACTTDQPAANHLETILENGNDNGASSNSEFAANDETALDIEQAHGMATGAAMKYYLADCSSTVPVGSGLTNATCNGSDVGLEEAVEDAADDPTLHTVSNSWGYGGEPEFGDNDPFKIATENSFAIAAAAGTTFWFSTGDNGTFESGYPADSQYVVGVGGTSDFSTTSLAAGDTAHTAVRSTQTAWSAGGSWCSTLEPRPSWQTGAAVTAKAPCPGRVVPDISAIADTNTSVFEAFTNGVTAGTPSVRTGGVGGTSVAAPEMNGMDADTEAFIAQQTYPGATPTVGFEGPMLYQLGNSAHSASYFQDVVCGNTANPSGGPDGDAASAGWDPATGWGEIDWFNYSTGYAIALGATGLTQPTSLAPGYAYSCAQTPTNAAQHSVSLPTGSIGYSVGAPSGSTPWPATFLTHGAWGATNNFLKTTDGGATWQTTNSDMMSVACVSASTCVEVGDGGRIRRTSDSGATWTYVASPFDKGLTSIACPTSSVCYAAGDRGAVLKSTDGGVSWTFLDTGDGNPLYGLACPTASICYAVDSYAHVAKTVNGGASWTLEQTPVTTPGVDVPGSGGPNPFAGLFGITCTDANTCVAVGGFPPVGTDPPIVVTTNGGISWALETSNAGANNDLNGVACVGLTCYAVGRTGAIVTSTDGGVTWTAMTSNTTNELTGIACSSASSCVATGQTGTVDVLSGGTWTPTSSLAGSNFLAAVGCKSGTSCVAAGKQGATLAFDPSNVAGSATLEAGGGTTQQMNSISCVDASHCVAVGNAGTIMTTSNAGQTWLPAVSGATASLSGVSCVASTCEAVGGVTAGAAVVLGSVDGGQTWAPQVSNSTVALSGVDCTSSAACVAVGAGGTVITTADGGSTWTPATSGTTANLTAVTCASASDCYAVGAILAPAAQATILASTDGGETWAAQNSNSPQSLSSIACVNPSACFAGGAIGTIVTTVDGGNTWTQQGDPISGPTSALNSGPTGITAIFAAACTADACELGTASAGDIMTTPVLTVTVNQNGAVGSVPALSGLAPSATAISYEPSGAAADVTGSLTCSTTATSSSPLGSYPVSECSGLSDPGFSVVYDLADSSYTVGQASQTIDFPVIGNMRFGAPDFTPSATASSGLPVEFAAAGACEIVTGKVHPTGAGSCTMTASQAGDADFLAAPDVQRTFAIAKATTHVALKVTAKHPTAGRITFIASVTDSIGVVPTGSVHVASGAKSCTIAAVGSTGSGKCSIVEAAGARHASASYSGNHNLAASTTTVSFTVRKAHPKLSVHTSVTKGAGGRRDIKVVAKLTGVSGVTLTGKVSASTRGGHCRPTLRHGTAHCTLTEPPGKYVITVTYAGNSNYAKTSKKVTVKVS